MQKSLFPLTTGLLILGSSNIKAVEVIKPNIIVILCDDLGYGDVGCYGSTKNRTPNIDYLANHGVRFTDCYAAANVSSPSRLALLTGRYPIRGGITRVLQSPDDLGVYNSMGTCIMNLLNGSSNKFIALPTTGFYIVRMKTEKGISVQKIMIK